MIALVVTLVSCSTAPREEVMADIEGMTAVPFIERIGDPFMARDSLPGGTLRSVGYLSRAEQKELFDAINTQFTKDGFKRLPGRSVDGGYRYERQERKRILYITPGTQPGTSKVVVEMFIPTEPET